MAWIMAHYKDVVLAVLAIDQALIPIFPKLTVLEKIKSALSQI